MFLAHDCCEWYPMGLAMAVAIATTVALALTRDCRWALLAAGLVTSTAFCCGRAGLALYVCPGS